MQRKLMVINQTALAKKRAQALVQPTRHNLAVHQVQNPFPQILPKHGIPPIVSKKEEDPKCMKRTQVTIMQMAVAASRLMVACRLRCILHTRAREGKKEIVQASNGEVFLRIRPHRGVLPSSEPLGGGCQDGGLDPYNRKRVSPLVISLAMCLPGGNSFLALFLCLWHR